VIEGRSELAATRFKNPHRANGDALEAIVARIRCDDDILADRSAEP